MTMKFKEGTVLVLPAEQDIAEVRRQEAAKEAREAARATSVGMTPAERFWIKQEFKPLSTQVKSSRMIDVAAKFEDTGVLEYPMTDFPMGTEPPPELQLLREAIAKLKPPIEQSRPIEAPLEA